MEKIKNIQITNFKSIKHLEINDCNKINVFIGMPNAGKSNILEALGLFGIINHLPDIDIKNVVRYNYEYELFFGGNINKEISINLNVASNEVFFKIFGQNLSKEDYKNLTGSELSLYSNFKEMIDFKGIKKYIFDNQRKQKRENNELSFPFGENIGQVLSNNNILREEFSKHLNINGLKMVIKSGTFELVLQKDLKDGTVFELPYNLIADTLQRLIFYKAAIMSNENSVLLFEEPEAHCFEPYVLEFANGVKYDKNDNQFFIVTHSDFIIQEFLRDEESKKDTNIYLVNNIDGETEVKLLEKDKNEEVYEYGMNAFFNFENLWENN